MARLPNQPDVEVNGTYTARLLGKDNAAAVHYITLTEKDLQASASVKRRVNGQAYTLSGYKASPVLVKFTRGWAAAALVRSALAAKR